jgi:hypothetical protein
MIVVVVVYGIVLPPLAVQSATSTTVSSVHCCSSGNGGVICIDACRLTLTDYTKYDEQMIAGKANWNDVASRNNIAVRIRFGDYGNGGWDVYDYCDCDTNVLGS